MEMLKGNVVSVFGLRNLLEKTVLIFLSVVYFYKTFKGMDFLLTVDLYDCIA
jgi:hypothetical protein